MTRAWLVAALVGALGCGQGAPGDPGLDAALPPDAAAPPADAVIPTVAPEIDGRLVVNELMASNAVTALDDRGEAGDWIELFNPTDQDIPLHGYALTVDLATPLAAVLPDGVAIAAGGYLLLWADGAPAAGATHLALRLPVAGGVLGLARPDGSWIDRLHYGAQVVDFSAAREPDGSDGWRIEWHASPGVANPAGDGQPVGRQAGDAPPEEVPAAGDLSEQILGYDAMPGLTLRVTPAASAALEVDPFTYVPAQLVYDGRSYGPVGVRVKGANSFEPFSQKPSLRIQIDRYVHAARFFALKDLTLDNMHSDFSMIHERLAYLVARTVGVPASRCNHALVTVNDQFYGLYANVETVKRNLLSRWFADDTGSLFEATDVDFAAPYVAQYGLESGPDDRTLLEGAAAALTLPDADAAIAAAGQYVDLDAFRKFWAMCAIVGQFDSFPYSSPGDDYFVYADPSTGRLVFLPWGMDETWYSARFDVTQTASILAARCKESPACYRALVDEVWAVLAATDELGLDAERARVAAQIAPYVALDRRKWYSDQDVLDFQGQLHWFVTERRADLATMLPPPSP